jgi:malate dehydrogenase (oxaloacetate-decarboxylating)(NADP+)
MATQYDLSLAYSPGVAAACEAIKADPDTALDYTARGNLVAVISNGTAVLGLGNIGPLAGKPVMEGKAVLFKKFAGIDVFDIEVDAQDPALFCDVVAALEPTFAAINLEDVKAPECFRIEAELRRRMKIPVFHDDQHGTAIIVAAAIRNGLILQGKQFQEVKLVTSGAGAAALACVDLLMAMGLKKENVTVTDINGVVYAGRPGMDDHLASYARETDARRLPDILPGADIFLGLSAPRVLKAEWLPLFADKPLILSLANPDPEILPDEVRARRADAIVATGRSDYPNQVNNVLCFPFIFRGALDVNSTTINEPMKVAAVEAVAELAHGGERGGRGRLRRHRPGLWSRLHHPKSCLLNSISSSATSSVAAAIRRPFSTTSSAALAVTQAPSRIDRADAEPPPACTRSVSPVIRLTCSGSTPSHSLTIWAKLV